MFDETALVQSLMGLDFGLSIREAEISAAMILGETQDEIDRLWSAILSHGGKEQACGWILDRWGVAWQITPSVIFKMYESRDQAAAKRAAESMMTMVKLDIAALQKAFDGG